MINNIQSEPGTKRASRMACEPKAAAEEKVLTTTPTAKVEPKLAKPSSKSGLVLGLLERPEGATINQIVAVTGWLPHTARAALTGLKKKGHRIVSGKAQGEERVYRVVAG